MHVLVASKKGFRKVSIFTVDTDVVVTALYHSISLKLVELYVKIGVGQHRRWIPVRKYAAILKEEVCRVLPFWFSITGCGTVFMFAGRGKETSWTVLQKYPNVIQTFVK